MMHSKNGVLLNIFVMILVCLAVSGPGGAVISYAQTEIPDAIIINDEGGPTRITGDVEYTNLFFTMGVAQPIVILEDQAGFIDRNEYFNFPQESQTLGQITSDFYTSPFSYSIALPIEPQGTLRNIGSDDGDGIMVFAVAYWTNTWGDPFLEERDQYGGGWSTAYASTEVSTDPERMREIVGGKLVVFAPDDGQIFSSGFGNDGLLFTDDDPMVRLPQGWTVVDLDSDPFTFDRSRHQEIDLLEPKESALVDYSDLSFEEAFTSMVDMFRREYAFTEYKNIDWDALEEEFLPRFTRATRNRDNQAYLDALREFLMRIPDGHVSIGPFSPYANNFNFDIAMGIGIAIRETDDGRAIVTYVLSGGPAEHAGIQLGAEIISLNNQPIAQVIEDTEPWTGPFSTDHNRRLEQQRFAMRFSADTRSVVLSYHNPGEDSAAKVTLTPVNEYESYLVADNIALSDGLELPVEYHLLDSGYGYVSINSFFDNTLLTIQLWERMIRQMQEINVPAIILDLRYNGGGNGFLADQMAAYFFNEPLVLGQRGYYNEDIDAFYFDPRSEQRFYLPADDLRFLRDVVVLVGPNCASACERFAYDMTLQDRAEIVGQYPTAGLGGSVNDFLMPLGMTVRYTTGRSVDADGNIHIEGTGIAPTYAVPVNEATLLGDGDPVLDYAIALLEGVEIVPAVAGGAITLGDSISGTLIPGQRVRYSFALPAGVGFDLVVDHDTSDLTTVVRFFNEAGNLLLSNEDDQDTTRTQSEFRELSTGTPQTLIIEVSSLNDQQEGEFTLSLTESR